MAKTPVEGLPYTFATVAEVEHFFSAAARATLGATRLEVLADPSWPGLRHAARLERLLLVLKVTFLLIGAPIAIACAERAWGAVAVMGGIAALLPVVALTWWLLMPRVIVVFNWRARTVEAPRQPPLRFDEMHLDLAEAAHGFVVWARGAGARFAVGVFRTEAVAKAYRERLELLLLERVSVVTR